MKTLVLVLVPYDVPGAALGDAVMERLKPHRQIESDESVRGRFDYLVGAFEELLNDPIAEGRLPADERRAWAGNVCDKSRVPPEVIPGALVTLDGAWHDVSDFGWQMIPASTAANQRALAQWGDRYRALLAAALECWVLAMWVHS